MIINSIFLQSCLHLRGQVKTFLCHDIVSAYLGKYFRSLAQRTYGHEIGRHQKLEGSRVVRRAERRSYQSRIAGRIAVPDNAFRIKLPVGHPQKPVLSVTVAPLLFPHHLQHFSDCLFPRTVEYGRIPGLLPILIRQPDRITMGIQFPFPLEDIRIRLRPVCAVRSPYRLHVEGICIRIDADALHLPPDYSGYHFSQSRISVSKLYVWPHLRPRIPHPHCRNIPGIYESVRIPVQVFTVMNRGIERIRKAVREHPCKSRIRQHRRDTFYFGFDHLRGKQTVFRCRPLRNQPASCIL